MVVALSAVVSSSAGPPTRDTSPSPGQPPPRPSMFHVSTSGSDQVGIGTRQRPWRTIAKACASTPPRAGHTILVEAGTYDESATCALPCHTNLIGLGRNRVSVRGSGAPLISVRNCRKASNTQTIAGLTLDGGDRRPGTVALRGVRVRGLRITRVSVRDFNGAGIVIRDASDFELSHSTLSNNAAETPNYCTGDLGLGNLTRASIHDVSITSPQGYSVKMTSRFGPSRDVEIYDNVFNALSSRCARWSTIAVELWFEAERVVFRNNWLNRPLSLPHGGAGTVPKRGVRWHIHHNHFALPNGHNSFAIEFGVNGSIVDHNFFQGGLYPLGQFHFSKVANGNYIHHNVFDDQEGPAAVWLDVAQVVGARFHNNTVVLRRAGWRDGVFSLGQSVGYRGSTLDIRRNIFKSAAPVGDKLGLGLGSATIDQNVFHNVSGRGSAQVLVDPQLSLAGGFPQAYLPPAQSPAAAFGAFAHGSWSVGPEK